MYRASMYDKHDTSMKKFVDLFNNSSAYPNLTMEPITEETFLDDGNIVDTATNQSIGFDWEYRDKYFSNGKFQFSTLGQYERKIVKPSIKISLQCDSTETAVAVAWHEDWMLEDITKLRLSTDTHDQFGKVRYTKYFKIYLYENITELKKMLNHAFEQKQFNKNSY